jgi:hypothetical protein
VLSQLAARALGPSSMASAMGPALQQQMRSYAEKFYFHMDRDTERGQSTCEQLWLL